MIPLRYFIRKYVSFIALMFIFFITQDSIAPKSTSVSDTSIPPSSNPPIPEKPKKGKTKPKTAPATLGAIPVPSDTNLKKKKEVAFETRKESQAARDNRSNGYVSQNKATTSSSKGSRKTTGPAGAVSQKKFGDKFLPAHLQSQKTGPTAASLAQVKLHKIQELINSNPAAKAALLRPLEPQMPSQTFSQHVLSYKSTPDTRAKMFQEFLALRYKNLPASVQKVHKTILKKISYIDSIHAHKSGVGLKYHQVDLRDPNNLPSHVKIVRPRNSKIVLIAGCKDWPVMEVHKVGDEYVAYLGSTPLLSYFSKIRLNEVAPMDEGQPEVRFEPGHEKMTDEFAKMKKQVFDLTHRNMINRLELNEDFVVSMCYKSALTFLLPELFKNFGICDEFNTDPSCFPTIPTRYVVPFATINGVANACALEVAMDPEELIRVIAQGGDFTMQGSRMVNIGINGSGSSWAWANLSNNTGGIYTTPSYLVDATTSTFNVNNFSLVTLSTGQQNYVQLQTQFVSGVPYYYYAVDSGSTVVVSGNTSDTTAAGYTSTCSFIILSAGAYSLSTSAPVNGQGGALIADVVNFSHTAPANSIGVYAFTIANAAAATTTFPAPFVSFSITAAPSDLVVSAGSSDGVDLQFIRDWVPDIRVVATSFRGIAWCGALSQILAVYGQYLANEADEMQAPTFQNYTANLRSKVKTLVGTDPGLYLPLLHRDYETVNFYNINEPSDVDSERPVEKGFIYLRAIDTDGEFFALESFLGLQCRPVPGLTAIDARPGTSCPEALSRVNNVLSREDLTFENPDHVAECMDIARETTSTETDSSFNINFAPSLSIGDISDIFI
jgi:hypothetical protein